MVQVEERNTMEFESDGKKTTREEETPKKRGFATLSAEKRKEISRKGGQSAHAAGTAHQFSSEEARRAGSIGGRASAKRKKAEKSGG